MGRLTGPDNLVEAQTVLRPVSLQDRNKPALIQVTIPEGPQCGQSGRSVRVSKTGIHLSVVHLTSCGHCKVMGLVVGAGGHQSEKAKAGNLLLNIR